MDRPAEWLVEAERGSVAYRQVSPVEASVRVVTRAFAVWAELSRLRPEEAVRRIAVTDTRQHEDLFRELEMETQRRAARGGDAWIMKQPSPRELACSWYDDPQDGRLKLQSSYTQEEHRFRADTTPDAPADSATLVLGVLRSLHEARVRDLADRNVRLLRAVLLHCGHADPNAPPTDAFCCDVLGIKLPRKPPCPPLQIVAA